MTKPSIKAALRRALKSGRPRRPRVVIEELPFPGGEVRHVLWRMLDMGELIFTWDRKVRLP